MIAPARSAAFDALRAVVDRRADLPAALADVRQRLGDRRDRALVSDVVTGTLRWQAMLDHVIAHFARRPVDRLDVEVLDVLRMSAYQLLRLDRVPPSAAVSDAVDLTRRARKPRAAGLVNAVLRAIATAKGDLPVPPPPNAELLTANANVAPPEWPAELRRQALDYVSIARSHPRWLVERWLDRLGYAATLVWTSFNNTPAPLTLRVNRLRTDVDRVVDALAREDVRVRPAERAPDGLVVVSGNPLRTSLADSGAFLVQNEASQLVSLLAAARPGEHILDACAAPGGKTTALATDMKNRGLLVATDARAARLPILATTVATSGASVVRIVQADLLTGAPFTAVFDCVIVDAPCTGLGTIRRDPDIRWRCQPTDLARMATQQLAMLNEAARVVRPGGRLLYATCSSEPEGERARRHGIPGRAAGIPSVPSVERHRAACLRSS